MKRRSWDDLIKSWKMKTGNLFIFVLNILIAGFVLETAASAGSLCAGYLIEGFNLEEGIRLVESGTAESYRIILPCLLAAFLIAGYIGKILWGIHEKRMTYFKLGVLIIYAFCFCFGNYEIIYMKLTVFITVLFVCILYQSNHYKEMIRELERMNAVGDERNRKVEEMSRIRHDISNHLVAAGYAEGDGYKEEIVRRIDDVIPVTGIAVVDTLLEYKKKVCEERNIRFACNRCRLKGENVELYDWVSIFGNILDNAIEACGNVKGERFIRMKLFYHEDLLCVELKNSRAAQELSGKKKRTFHEKMKYKDKRGLGIGIVKDTVQKYDGMFSADEKEDTFEVHIMLRT